jgi:hypothetical protein
VVVRFVGLVCEVVSVRGFVFEVGTIFFQHRVSIINGGRGTKECCWGFFLVYACLRLYSRVHSALSLKTKYRHGVRKNTCVTISK